MWHRLAKLANISRDASDDLESYRDITLSFRMLRYLAISCKARFDIESDLLGPHFASKRGSEVRLSHHIKQQSRSEQCTASTSRSHLRKIFKQDVLHGNYLYAHSSTELRGRSGPCATWRTREGRSKRVSSTQRSRSGRLVLSPSSLAVMRQLSRWTFMSVPSHMPKGWGS